MRAMKKVQCSLALLGLVSLPALATDIITVDPDGGGSLSSIQIGSLGWNNAFTIAVGALPTGSGTISVGDVFTTFGQGALSNFINANGDSVTPTGLNSSWEWTFVFGVQEVVTATGNNNATFASTGAGTNFFDVYYGPKNSNITNGTGFADGTLILSGSFLPFNTSTGSGISTFTESSTNAGNLDQFGGVNNYPGVQTVGGAGSFNLLASVTYANPLFFANPLSLISVTNNGFTNVPFTETNPSSCYWDGSALSSAIGPNTVGGPCTVNTVGAVNGIDGPNFAFESRPTSAFTTAVPEPGSVALIGLALGILGWTVRRKQS